MNNELERKQAGIYIKYEEKLHTVLCAVGWITMLMFVFLQIIADYIKDTSIVLSCYLYIISYCIAFVCVLAYVIAYFPFLLYTKFGDEFLYQEHNSLSRDKE